MARSSVIFLLCLAFISSIFTQEDSLVLREIMRGEDFTGYQPDLMGWSDDGSKIYFKWNPEANFVGDTYEYSLALDSIRKLTMKEADKIPPHGYSAVDDKWAVFARKGDIFLRDVEGGITQPITNTMGSESNPVFIRNDSAVAFQLDDQMYIWWRHSGLLEQISHFSKDKEKKKEGDKTDNPQRNLLELDQLHYFEILKLRKDREEFFAERDSILKGQEKKPLYLNDRQVVRLSISPDANYLFYTLSKRADNQSTKVADFVTTSGYVEDLNARPKVGSPAPTYESWIYNVKLDTHYQYAIESLDGIKNRPAFLREYMGEDDTWDAEFEQPREVIINGPVFNLNGTAMVVDVRTQDNKDRWLAEVDPDDGSLQVLDHQHDEAWIGGPGIGGWDFSSGNSGWLEDGETFYFQSEESGFSHLYTWHRTSNEITQLTSGEFEILSADPSPDEAVWYIISNKLSPHEQHFYTMPLEGGEMTQITSKPGKHEVIPSPDGSKLAVRYSFTNQPWEVYWMENNSGTEMHRITHSTTSEFQTYEWRIPDIVHFAASDGVEVPARLYTPENKQAGGPAVIFVHGAGYLQNVHRWWSSYFREYMFHNFLADRGYTVLDIDYRGSAGYGRDWRTAIYRHMGGKDLSDQIEGAKYLVEMQDIDPDRVGIYGGSYGGFITIMALCTSPGTYQCGAALRSVTDWAHYNHEYTSNILNTPMEDSIAYRRSSPIYHAEGLQGELLMLHGMVDRNVQFQDVVRLAQRFIELGKEDWHLAVFPVEGHSFSEPTSWADEYRRIFELFERNLKGDVKTK